MNKYIFLKILLYCIFIYVLKSVTGLERFMIQFCDFPMLARNLKYSHLNGKMNANFNSSSDNNER